MTYTELLLAAHEKGYPFSEVYVAGIGHKAMLERMELGEVQEWLRREKEITVWWRPSTNGNFIWALAQYRRLLHLSSPPRYHSPQQALLDGIEEALKLIEK